MTVLTMLRPLALALLALTITASPALASAADVQVTDPCERWSICPILRTELYPLRVCAGLGLGLQGVATCVYENPYGALCVRVIFGFHVHDTCDLTITIVDIDSAAAVPRALP